MAKSSMPWFRRHPRLALLLMNVGLLTVLALICEGILRVAIPYNPGFYTAVKVRDRELVHPYGIIKINSEGYPDEEWDLSKTQRVGYFGDSVTYGVGAGYGYRVSEILERAYPDLEHMNIGGIGLSISEKEIHWAADLATRLGMQRVVYLFNLNDILPNAVVTGEQRTVSQTLRERVLVYVDWLRGRSYLYTFLRNKAKTFLAAHGQGFHGFEAYELFPVKNTEILRETAGRINRFHEVLAERGIELILVMLPYEMQISAEAEARYRELGVHWERGFIDRGTQRLIQSALEDEIPAFDAYYAFVDPARPAETRAANGLGEYFVYNKGDKLDWNHPNRSGHRAIAEFLIREKMLGEPHELKLDGGAS